MTKSLEVGLALKESGKSEVAEAIIPNYAWKEQWDGQLHTAMVQLCLHDKTYLLNVAVSTVEYDEHD